MVISVPAESSVELVTHCPARVWSDARYRSGQLGQEWSAARQPALVDEDRARFEEFARTEDTHILVAPRSDLTHPVVVTGWTRMLRLDEANLDAIDAFYDRFARVGPELGVLCPFQADQAVA